MLYFVCFACRLMAGLGLHKQGRPEQAFITRGDKKLKCAVSDFKDDQTSLGHVSIMDMSRVQTD